MALTGLSPEAAAQGLRLGQALAEARALFPGLEVMEEDAAADTALLNRLADWCDRYTPLVACDRPDALLLDITGCAHLFGGEEALLSRVLDDVGRFGFTVKGAIADSAALSSAMVRFGSGGVILPGEGRRALAPLPVAALRLEAPVVKALTKLGFRQIGDLLDAPRAPLVRRFGQGFMLRLDQALGLQGEPISPRRTIAPVWAEKRLLTPIDTVEAILSLVGPLAETFLSQLEARGTGGRLFELALFRVDGTVLRVSAGSSTPLRAPARILALFSARLTNHQTVLDAGFGFEIVRLNVLHDGPFQAMQGALGQAEGEDMSLSAFLDSIAARFGDHFLMTSTYRQSHVPERAVESVPAAHALFSAPPARIPPVFTRPNRRPIRLLDPPELVEAFAAEVPDGPPAAFRWRRLRHQVRHAEGPERIAPEWWRDGQGAATRDYFRVEDEEGYRFWIFRDGFYDAAQLPRWYMHGLFA
ncbi:DNA repair protein [Xaviernesmea oryzae]|uniref:DNA repair protein n=2 Tax=Xaviernesmea oryzae TaxID=464029 RepID=A0A1Q9AYF2_9HYPH|nr:DNA repair protein [Xaviernesmea oryzae]SEK20970.1 protein ImuB [Xaviernesmea oryzae]